MDTASQGFAVQGKNLSYIISIEVYHISIEFLNYVNGGEGKVPRSRTTSRYARVGLVGLDHSYSIVISGKH